MIIIQPRGTSGCGKSTVIRKIIEKTCCWERMFVEGRKRPLYYMWNKYGDDRDKVILGHYEPAGGCDSLGDAKAAYNLINDLDGCGIKLVLAEGLLLSEDVKWTVDCMERGNEILLLFLTTPIDECMRRIHARRQSAVKKTSRPLNPTKTPNRAAQIERARLRLIEVNVPCRRVTQEQAVRQILKQFRLHAEPGGKGGPRAKLADHSKRR